MTGLQWLELGDDDALLGGVWLAMAYAKLMDVASTEAVLGLGGLEANPLSRIVLDAHGVAGLWVKAAWTLVLVGALMVSASRLARRSGFPGVVVPASFAPVLGVVVFAPAWNLWVLASW